MNNEEDIVKDTLQHNTQQWEELLHATGGKLELQKCKYCVFSWSFNDDGSVSLNDQHNITPIQLISSETQQSLEVEAITTNTSYKLLGVQIAFDANSKEQHKTFQSKCIQLARLFSQLPLIAPEIHAGYVGVALPSLRYTLAATSIPASALQQSQKVFINALLPKLGYNRHFPRKVTFAPTQVGGLGIQNFAVEQSISHVLTIIAHLRGRETPLTSNCIQLLESYQIYSGILTSPTIFTQSIPYIPDNIAPWLEIIRTFLRQINARIDIPQLQQINTIRTNDRGIMQTAMTFYDDKRTLSHINNCRLYLQVNTVAEITNCHGTHILPQALYGTYDETNQPCLHAISTSKLNWPAQHRPPTVAWTLWKTFIQQLIKPTTSTTLSTPLGPWKATVHSQRTWKFAYIHDRIIQHQQSHDIRYFCQTTSPTIFVENPAMTPNIANLLPFPRPATPVTVSSTTITMHRQSSRLTNTSYELTPNISSSPWHNGFRIEPVASLDNLDIATSINIYTQSKLQYQSMLFHWQISTETVTYFEMHGSATPSNHPTKLRAETYAIIYALSNVIQHSRLQAAKNIKVWITQRSLYTKLQSHYVQTPSSTLLPESENITTIRHLLAMLPIVTLHDASHHQEIDEHQAFQLKSFYQAPISIATPIRHSFLPGNIATLSINDVEISSNPAVALRSAATTPDYKEYLLERHPTWTTTTIDTIDWQVQANAIRRLNFNQQKTIKKFIHNWLPTNGHPSCSHALTTICPLCNAENETQSHFLTCPELSNQWQHAVTCITTHGKTLNLDPSLLTLITQALSNYQQHVNPIGAGLHYSYATLIKQQNQLGWSEILCGRLSTQWARLQDRHTGLFNGHQTFTRFIHYIYTQVLTIWNHRCNIQHDNSSKHQLNVKNQLLVQVQALYNTRPKLLQLDQLMFDVPIPIVMAKPLNQLKFWIQRTTIIVKEGLQRAKAFTKHNTPSIKTFFPPKPSTRPTTCTRPVVIIPNPKHPPRQRRHKRRTLTIDDLCDSSDTSSCSPSTKQPQPKPLYRPSSPSSTSTVLSRPTSPPDRYAAQNYNIP